MTVCANARARRIQKMSSLSLGIIMSRIVCPPQGGQAVRQRVHGAAAANVRFRPMAVFRRTRRRAGLQ
jgi:hypothetical protein